MGMPYGLQVPRPFSSAPRGTGHRPPPPLSLPAPNWPEIRAESPILVTLQAMLKEGHKHLSGLEEAVLKNIEACKQLAQITRTSMGPNGTRKATGQAAAPSAPLPPTRRLLNRRCRPQPAGLHPPVSCSPAAPIPSAAGMNKMVINHLEKLFVTSDASTIVAELEVQHPAAKLLVMAAQAQQQEIGDGTNMVRCVPLGVL